RSVAARSVGSISGFWHGAPQRVIEIDVLNSAGPIFERIAIRLTRLLFGAHRPVALDVAELYPTAPCAVIALDADNDDQVLAPVARDRMRTLVDHFRMSDGSWAAPLARFPRVTKARRRDPNRAAIGESDDSPLP